MAFGKAIDFNTCDPKTKQVNVVADNKTIGIYIEVSMRPMFNFTVNMHGLPTAEEIKRENPEKFDEIKQGALKVLPHI